MTTESRLGLIAFGLAGGLVVLAGGAVGVVALVRAGGDPATGRSDASASPAASGPSRSTTSKPDAGREGQTWTHDDLYRYLNGRTQKHIHRRPSNRPGKCAWFAFSDIAEDNPIAWDLDEEMDKGPRWHGGVWVKLCDTAREANELAGSKGENGWAWGRFFFYGHENNLADIRAALTR